MAARRKVRVLRLSWPVEPATFVSVLAGKADALDHDPFFSRLLVLLHADNPLGDFGLYKSVAEVSPCLELFQPQGDAKPAHGRPGQSEVSTNLMVTIHVDSAVAGQDFEALLDQLVASHPWEVPVIEISEAELALSPAHTAR